VIVALPNQKGIGQRVVFADAGQTDRPACEGLYSEAAAHEIAALAAQRARLER
jgi:hypothetical protein